MISIIIASGSKSLLQKVTENIHNTIGLPFEILDFENSSGKKGLCEIYNLGAKQAKYDILCFMHEDIFIHTSDWGILVHEIFKESNSIGILGIAGSTYKSYTPSAWFPASNFGTSSWRVNINQGIKYQSIEKKHDYYNPKNERISQVASIDGVWFCTTKKIAVENKFDELLLKGFHGYDLDFSLNVGRHYQIVVTYDILITHDSDGNFDDSWLKENIKIHQKWNEQLPINYNAFTVKESAELEAESLNKFLKNISRNSKLQIEEISDILDFYYKSHKINVFEKYMYYLRAWILHL